MMYIDMPSPAWIKAIEEQFKVTLPDYFRLELYSKDLPGGVFFNIDKNRGSFHIKIEEL